MTSIDLDARTESRLTTTYDDLADRTRANRRGGAWFLLAGLFAGAGLALLLGERLGLSPGATAAAPASSQPAAAPAPAPVKPEPVAAAVASPYPPEGYAGIARTIMPAVVNISSLQVIQTYESLSPFMSDPFFQQFFGGRGYDSVVPRERRELSLGSGVIVDERGTILTNNHVVEHATEVKVALADGRELPARILGVDPRTDLAVLRVDSPGLPHATLGDSDQLEVGDIVLAFGNPFGLGGTVTMGIVSAMGRGNLGLADYEDFIQTDAAINPGNSGGALVDTHGEVIGINTAIFSRSGGYQGIGFSIPSTMAREVLEDLLEHGKVVRGYAGLAVQALTPDLARAFGLGDLRGAVVTSLDPQGPSTEAGLKRGDVIVSFRDRPISTDEDLRTQMSRLKPGDRASLGVMRNGRKVSAEVVLGEPPQVAPRPPQRRRG
ncbi:MAG TPA: Do family serine endopeptidase [Dongiaceae bacterium]|nr:Do family serine endopeptidase [Dongiaceae bacterium]